MNSIVLNLLNQTRGHWRWSKQPWISWLLLDYFSCLRNRSLLVLQEPLDLPPHSYPVIRYIDNLIQEFMMYGDFIATVELLLLWLSDSVLAVLDIVVRCRLRPESFSATVCFSCLCSSLIFVWAIHTTLIIIFILPWLLYIYTIIYKYNLIIIIKLLTLYTIIIC